MAPPGVTVLYTTGGHHALLWGLLEVTLNFKRSHLLAILTKNREVKHSQHGEGVLWAVYSRMNGC